MPFHHDQKLSLPASGTFRLKEWRIENEDDRELWWHCSPGQVIATLESDSTEFDVVCLFEASITKQFVMEGDEVTQDTFFLQWVADGENLPYSGRDFEVRQKQPSEQGAAPNRLTRSETDLSP
jgi:pyruvate/2-oxoglutarate dehydrogenase complex dihydrolipoamide acyltransferase (E2) component